MSVTQHSPTVPDYFLDVCTRCVCTYVYSIDKMGSTVLSCREQVIQNYLVCSSRDMQLRVLMLRYDICA